MSGWTSLFKRSPKLKADPLIRWFGKLPATREYNDYYRSANEPWMNEFHEDWLIRGYELYNQRMRSAHQGRPNSKMSIPVSSCVLRLPKSGMTVLAAILDFGGDTIGRPFPLCFYVGLPTADWIGPTSDRIWSAMLVLKQLAGLQRDVVRFLNEPGQKKPEQFSALFRDREINLDRIAESDGQAWCQQAQGVGMNDWFARTDGGLGASSVTAWMHLADRWGDRIAAAECEDFQATLSFPVASGIAPEVQVAGWIRWLEARMYLGRRAISLMLTEEPTPRLPRLSIVSRDLMPEDFLLMTPLVSDLTYLDDLSRVCEEANTHTLSAPGSDGDGRAAVGPAEPTWADFVQGRAKLGT